MSEVVTGVGLNIKTRRKELGLSLREVARQIGLTASFLSQVERGQSNASLDSLRRIADALDTSLLQLLEEDIPAPDISRSDNGRHVHLVRAGYRPRRKLPDSDVSYELLTPDTNRDIEVIRGCISPGSGNVARPLKVPTEECVYVLSGALLLGLDSEVYVLHPGDSIYFEGAQLKRIECASDDEDAEWLSMITPAVF